MAFGIGAVVLVYEAVLLGVTVAGYPFVARMAYNQRSWWFFFAYTAVLIGIASTVLEAFFEPGVFEVAEPVVGVMAAGIIFAVCAYISWKRIDNLEYTVDEEVELE